jgi:hypothetical protein
MLSVLQHTPCGPSLHDELVSLAPAADLQIRLAQRAPPDQVALLVQIPSPTAPPTDQDDVLEVRPLRHGGTRWCAPNHVQPPSSMPCKGIGVGR